MIGSNGSYYANTPIYYKTTNGDYAEITMTDTGFAMDENAGCEYKFDPFPDSSFTCKIKIGADAKAQLFGFKNANCMSRYIRRMKRKKEQERRRMLKNGAGRNNESH